MNLTVLLLCTLPVLVSTNFIDKYNEWKRCRKNKNDCNKSDEKVTTEVIDNEDLIIISPTEWKTGDEFKLENGEDLGKVSDFYTRDQVEKMDPNGSKGIWDWNVFKGTVNGEQTTIIAPPNSRDKWWNGFKFTKPKYNGNWGDLFNFKPPTAITNEMSEKDVILKVEKNGKKFHIVVRESDAEKFIANPKDYGYDDVDRVTTVEEKFACSTVPGTEDLSEINPSPACGCCLPEQKVDNKSCQAGATDCGADLKDLVIYSSDEECRMRCVNHNNQSIQTSEGAFLGFEYLTCTQTGLEFTSKHDGRQYPLGNRTISCITDTEMCNTVGYNSSMAVKLPVVECCVMEYGTYNTDTSISAVMKCENRCWGNYCWLSEDYDVDEFGVEEKDARRFSTGCDADSQMETTVGNIGWGYAPVTNAYSSGSNHIVPIPNGCIGDRDRTNVVSTCRCNTDLCNWKIPAWPLPQGNLTCHFYEVGDERFYKEYQKRYCRGDLCITDQMGARYCAYYSGTTKITKDFTFTNDWSEGIRYCGYDKCNGNFIETDTSFMMQPIWARLILCSLFLLQ